jgi:hypothetical protein
MYRVTKGKLDLAVVLPCLNDSASLAKLVSELVPILNALRRKFVIYICDDGSTNEELDRFRQLSDRYPEVDVLIGDFKSGHQNAILRGLMKIEQGNSPLPDVIIMDADGEDNPEHVPQLLNQLQNSNIKAVLAKRGIRHSGVKFALMHKAFNFPFKLLTGKKLETGNFMAIKGEWLPTLLKLPSVANHVSTTIIRFAPKVETFTFDRNKRYFGKTKMNLSSLSLHGFGALAVYAEIALSRLIIGTSILAILLGSISLILVCFKTFTDANFLPGWTSSAVIQILSLTIITVFQALTTTIVILWTKKK